MITSDQTTAPQTLLPAGAPSHSAAHRVDDDRERVDFGELPAAPSGIEATGTNAEEMNVSGKTAMKPTELAASGEDTSSPRNANTHENA